MRDPIPVPQPTATRSEVRRTAEVLRRAYLHLKSHEGRVTDEQAAAHAEALRVARGMVRKLVDSEGKS
jgi:hypothetical protein